MVHKDEQCDKDSYIQEEVVELPCGRDEEVRDLVGFISSKHMHGISHIGHPYPYEIVGCGDYDSSSENNCNNITPVVGETPYFVRVITRNGFDQYGNPIEIVDRIRTNVADYFTIYGSGLYQTKSLQNEEVEGSKIDITIKVKDFADRYKDSSIKITLQQNSNCYCGDVGPVRYDIKDYWDEDPCTTSTTPVPFKLSAPISLTSSHITLQEISENNLNLSESLQIEILKYQDSLSDVSTLQIDAKIDPAFYTTDLDSIRAGNPTNTDLERNRWNTTQRNTTLQVSYDYRPDLASEYTVTDYPMPIIRLAPSYGPSTNTRSLTDINTRSLTDIRPFDNLNYHDEIYFIGDNKMKPLHHGEGYYRFKTRLAYSNPDGRSTVTTDIVDIDNGVVIDVKTNAVTFNNNFDYVIYPSDNTMAGVVFIDGNSSLMSDSCLRYDIVYDESCLDSNGKHNGNAITSIKSEEAEEECLVATITYTCASDDVFGKCPDPQVKIAVCDDGSDPINIYDFKENGSCLVSSDCFESDCPPLYCPDCLSGETRVYYFDADTNCYTDCLCEPSRPPSPPSPPSPPVDCIPIVCPSCASDEKIVKEYDTRGCLVVCECEEYEYATTTTTTTTLAPPPPPPTDTGAVRSPVFSIQYYWQDYGDAVYRNRASAWNWRAHNPSEGLSEVFQDAFNLRVGEIFTPDFGIITEIITARIDNSWLNDIAATSTDGFHGTILFSVDSLKPDGGSGYQTEFEIANARGDLYDPYLFARFDRNQGVVLTNRNSELSGNSWFVGENIRYHSPNFFSTVGNTSSVRYRDTSVTRSNRTVTLTRSSPLVQPRNDKVELLPIATTYNYRYRGVVIIRDDGEWKRSEYVYFEVPVTRVTFEVVSRVFWFPTDFSNPIREP